MRDPIQGLPSIGTARTATPRRIIWQGSGVSSPVYSGNFVIDGSESRDSGNTGDLDVLRAGVLLGKITASGLYAPAFAGQITGDYTSGGTTLTVSAAQAVEINRLVGSSGSSELVCIGAPTESGTVAVTAFDHSAIDTSTGAITVTSLGVNKHAGSIIAVNDGRYVPRLVVGDTYGIKVTDSDDNSVDVSSGELLLSAALDTAKIVLYPDSSDTSLVAWVKEQMRLSGLWLFSDDFE